MTSMPLCLHKNKVNLSIAVKKDAQLIVNCSKNVLMIFLILQDRDECLELPSICGERVKCLNTPGDICIYKYIYL